ncbi:Protein RCC2 [Hypsizygus marmoreus]|uniref:Protein RCC2 n=1 Tax=Hypsizygus marmoreus TaxID=39966 RepID=A0A369KAG9_HYPMA|nr:Protein RCC2 [Hypsizygus marmoreus]
MSSTTQQWGRVLICGGTDWPKLGKKERGGAKLDEAHINPDLPEPHILRSLSNVEVVSVHTSCSGCHFVVLDTSGAAWLFGRNGFGALGIPPGPAGDEYVSENAPMKLLPSELGAEKGTKFVHAACGRNHTLLVGSDGSLWTAGANSLAQCGHSACNEVTSFKPVSVTYGGEKENVVMATAGVTFSIVLTESGKVFSFGSAEKGQLGNGTTGERITTGNKTAFDIEPSPIYIKELDGKNIVEIASGPQHSLALDSTGVVYVWGYNGYCRLGLGNQVDALKPKVVPQFAGPNDSTMGAHVVAGPSNSVVIDKQGMYWMAGKWKNSGEGSSGSPYSTFRFMQDIMGCKISLARCGGVTHWALTPDDDDSVMTVAWGQNAANGELGLGPDEPKSATKPTRNLCLVGIDVFDIAAGQNTTLILARPNDKLSDLPRHPVELDVAPLCVTCGKEKGEDDSPLACDKCDSPYHLGCLNPPLTAVPDGEWFCVPCRRAPGAPIGNYPIRKGNAGKQAKGGRKAHEVKEAADGGADAEETGVKRKAPGGAGKAPKKKRQ